MDGAIALPLGAINARAKIEASKRAGCTDLISVSAVGSLREDLPPGTFVVVDQFIDRSVARPSSLLWLQASSPMSRWPILSARSCRAQRRLRHGRPERRRWKAGFYVAIEGPQFLDPGGERAVPEMGCLVIGMTAMPEARLAREAELPYASVCMVTDYDCWRAETAHVEVADVLATMKANADMARRMLGELVRALPQSRPASPIDSGLDRAVVTDPAVRDPALMRKLSGICPRPFSAG